MNSLLAFVGLVAAGMGAGIYGLSVRDLVRRGRLHRERDKLISQGNLPVLRESRVPCPECAEAILPQAKRCPFCRSVIVGTI